ncbi:MAG: hypothetical protein LBQ33_06210 [Oscillospiraceae bacterium]|jgi:hypothetical protein|nr:hypothetical protein [Oscillospiraceae bacterium]
MKKRILALLLCLTFLFAGAAIPAQAESSAVNTAAALTLPDAVKDGMGLFHAVENVIADAAEDIKDVVTLPPATLFSIRGFFIILDKVMSQLIKVLLTTIETLLPPVRHREDAKDYTSENFLPGRETLQTQAGDQRFSLGYASESILPADFGEKPYRMGGYDFNKFATETYDDLRVRTVVLDDGNGQGAVAFAVLDVIGLANADVRAIRAKLKDLTGSGALASVNVAVTHTHSAIDSQGLWGNDLFALLANNFGSAYLPSLIEPMQGVDQTFLQTMIDQTAKSIRDAYGRLEEGTLYLSKKNAKGYFSDKVDPYIYEENVYRLRFQPDALSSKPTLIANFGAHPERVGLITDDNPGNVVSADFVPYIEDIVDDLGGYNFLYIQGPIGTRISADIGPASDGLPWNRLDGTKRYGYEMGYFLLGMTKTEAECAALYAAQYAKDLALIEEHGVAQGAAYTLWYKDWVAAEETPVDAFLNVAHKEFLVEVKNPVLKAAGKLWLADNKMLYDRATGKTYTLTEVGYLQLGNSLKILLQPGETSPELLLGGSNLSAEGSVSGKAFPLAPLRETFGETVIVFDLVNDSIGYIIPDNDSTSFLLRYVDGQLTDINSLGSNLNDALLLTFSTKVASTVLSNFLELVDSLS